MDYFIADPAGNITAFVLSAPDLRAAERLLSDRELKIEQVAFLTAPRQGGHIKCDMAGGEFCGNACRAAAYYHALKQRQARSGQVLVEMSGSGGRPVRVWVDTEHELAYADMPQPQGMTTVSWDGRELPAVVFAGVIHVVAPASLMKSLDLSAEKMQAVCGRLQTSALGVMFLGPELRLTPVVWVDEVGSLIWESSCGSGSAACGWYLSQDLQEGRREYRFRQPGGVLEIRLERRDGHSRLEMGGTVKLLDNPFMRRLGP